jgi:D-beta-D-heptose 7-phosphate kinase/D-beta-D-heptose 1-phosphate adenosyltransferase
MISPLGRLLEAFAGRRIVILGDVMLDEYIWGHARRISPEAPVPVVEAQRRTCTPGGAGNAAANVLSLGGRAILGGVVGTDAHAKTLRETLRAGGIDVGGLFDDVDRPTTAKTRIMAHNQHMVRLDSESRQPLTTLMENQLLSWAEQQVPQADACLISDYGKGVLTRRLTENFIRLARTAGKPVVVDPKGSDYVKYRGATVLTPNVPEAETATQHEIARESDLLEAGRRLLELLQGSAILITRGPDGMSLFRPSGPPIHAPAEARQVFDVTGAGDTAIVTFALSLAAGATLEQAMQLANRAAGIVVGKPGTATVSLDELRHYLETAAS